MRWSVYWVDEPIARFENEVDANDFCASKQYDGYDCWVKEEIENERL